MEQRIKDIENRLDALEQASTIPLSLERSLKARGFLTGDDFVVGQTEVGVSGSAFFGIPNANKYSMAFAFYADFPDVNPIDAYIEPISGGGYQLHLEAVTSKRINYIVFLNTRIKPDIT